MVDAPDSALASYPLTISYRVRNSGAQATPTSVWVDTFYLSTDTKLDSGDLFLGNRAHHGALAAVGSYTESGTFTLPNGLVGSYYAMVVTDSHNYVFEGAAENNNVGFDASLITVSSRPADLVVVQARAPLIAESGTGILVEWTVTNQGTGSTVVNQWSDSIFASADAVLGNDPLLGSFNHTGVLNSGESYSRSETLSIPFEFTGQYYLFIITDTNNQVFEANNDGNNASTALPVTVQRLTADLQVTGVTAPTTLRSGESITVGWTVQNLGVRATNSNYWHDDIYLSADTVIDSSDMRLGSVQHSGVLAPSNQYNGSQSFRLPLDLTGSFYLIVRTDSHNRVLEGALENNNDRATASSTDITLNPVPDLVLESVDGPTAGVGGQVVSITWTVANRGGNNASGYWFDAFYLSRDQIFDPASDIYLGYYDHQNGLAVGDTYTESQVFLIPNGISGLFYIFGVADSSNRVYERGNEANNVTITAMAALITTAPPADLVVGIITVPATGIPGQNATITYTVTNQGLNPALGNWFDSVYLSADDKWDIADKLFGRVHHQGNVGAGSSYTETLTAKLGALAPGDYYVIIRTDILNQIVEKDEQNNVRASLDRVDIDVAELVLGTSAEGFIHAGDAVYYRVEVPAGETLLITLDSEGAEGSIGEQGSMELYVRYGDLPTQNRFDFAFSKPFAPDQEVMVTATRKGTYYIMVYNVSAVSVPKPSSSGGFFAAFSFNVGASASLSQSGVNYTLTARTLDFSLLKVSPNYGSIRGQATVVLTGSKLTYKTTASLVAPGTARAASRLWWKSSTEMWATFDLTGLALDSYDVRLERDTETAILEDAFTVTNGPVGKVEVGMSSPSAVRNFQHGVLVVDYMNAGETDVPAPVLVIAAENAELRLPVQKDFAGSSMQLLAINKSGPAGILTPGARGQFTLIFKPTIVGGEINFSVRLLSSGDQAVSWEELRDDLRPIHIVPEAWEAIWQNFTATIGDTLGSYQAVLAENATRLSQLGYYISNVSELMSFEMMQARNMLPFGILDAEIDATAFVPSPPLTFSRVYLQPLDTRLRLGPLGRGWVHSWEISLSEDAIGDVMIQAMGATRLFSRQPDGSYKGDKGEHATLTVEEGAYFLRELNRAVLVFHPNGLLNYVEDANGNRITLGYEGSRLTRIVHSNGESFTLSYNAHGRISQLVDHAGRVTTYAYDNSGEHLLSVTAPTGTWSYTYDNSELVARRHSLLSITYPNNTHNYFEYDEQGRLSRWHKDGGAELLSYSYDSAGGIQVTDENGVTVTYLYDQFGQIGQLQDALGGSTRFIRDAKGNLIQMVQPGDIVYSFSYGAFDQLLSYVDPMGNRVEFTYDPMLNLLATMRDPRGNVTKYGYDERGNPLSITYPDGSARLYTYDSLGNALTSVNGRGQRIQYTYDRRGLLTRKDFPDGSSVSFTYDSHGNMLSATDSTGTTTMTYDQADRLVRITYPSGRYLEYTHDAEGWLTQMVDQDGFTVRYVYDAAGRLVRLTGGNDQPITSYTYDDAGNIIRKDMNNGTYTTYEYNAVGQVLHIVNHALGGAVNSRFDYNYDGLGRLVSMTTLEGEWTYTYDAIGQLVSITLPGGRSIEYNYDAAGNRTSVTDNGVTTAYATNNLNQYTHVGSFTYTYDADGNLVSKTNGSDTWQYTYDSEDRLVREMTPQGTWTYDYDFLSQLTATVHDGERTEYLIDPGILPFVTAQYDGSGNLVAHYTHALGLVSQVNPQGQAFYYDFDSAGSTVGLTGLNGTYANTYKYLPFGEILTSVEQVPTPFTYTGQFGVMTGGSRDLFLMTNRWYSASVGRFVSPDPIDLLGGDVNLYRYVANSPINSIDPEGLWATNFGALSNTKAKYLLTLLRRAGDEGLFRFQWKTLQATWHTGFSREYGWHLARLIKKSTIERHWYLGETVNFNTATKAVTKTQWFTGARFLGKALGVVGWCYTAWEVGWWIGTQLREHVIPQSWQDALGNALYKVVGPIWDWWDSLWSRRTRVVRPVDPNDMVGPPGFGDEHWVTATETLPYTIRFENQSAASAPAQVVTINHPLDSDLDWRTFRVGGFGWGELFFEVPENRAFYNARLDLRESHGFFVDATVGINIATGEAFWTIATIDPETGEVPEDPLIGFLPPNNTEGAGQGFVTYTIRPRRDATTGTAIDAQARIVFDTEEPIDTPPIVNTIDAGVPSSTVASLPRRTESSEFNVSWSGRDDEGGSALANFTIFVSDNNGAYAPWLQDTSLTEAIFVGEQGHAYGFYSVAADNAGNKEASPTAADTSVSVRPGGIMPGDTNWDSLAQLPQFHVQGVFSLNVPR